MLGLLYADDLVLCGEEEDLRFAEVCRTRGLKVNAGNSKVMALKGEEGLACKVHVDGVEVRLWPGRAYNLKGIKGKFSVFLLFLKLCFSFTVAHFLA